MLASNENNLIVYKASAGSGKTFSLVLEYISLLIENPKNYKYILAITFTNKATAEMKQRILKELLEISNGNKTDFFLALIERYPNLSETDIALKLRKALTNILHDYSYFNILTIDSFLQRLMRSLTKELGVGSNYNLLINDRDILKRSIERLIEDSESDKTLYEWYIEMIDTRIDDNQRVDIEKELLEFSFSLSKEEYQVFESKIRELDKKSLEDFKRRGEKEVKIIENELKTYGDRFVRDIEQRGLGIADFSSGTRGIGAAIYKIREGEYDFRDRAYYSKAKDDATKWYSKEKQTDANISFAESVLIPLLSDYFTFYDSKIERLNSWTAILPFVLRIGLLKDISQYRETILKEDNKFILSDTSKLLVDIISLGGGDISFLYEKIGTQLRYIMIDEFQDTSKLNWETIRPLVVESLDTGSKSVILGDVKQSIYRWRNGDWTILKDIEKGINFNQTPNNPHKPKINLLQTNYRSFGNIVEFNNFLFKDSIYLIKENFPFNEKNTSLIPADKLNIIEDVFKDAQQKTRKDYDGLGEVRCKFLIKEEDLSIKEIRNKRILSEIKYFTDKNYKYSDISLLFRTNKELRETSALLRDNGINIVSDEAFTYQSSSSIRLIIEALRYLSSKNNTISLINLKLYFLNAEEVLQDIDRVKDEKTSIKQLSWIEDREEILNKPLLDLILFLINEMELQDDEKERSFISSFLDKVQEYLKTDSLSGLNNFLKYWEDELKGKKIAINEGVDGINLQTIHKAKGLEYRVVILPYTNWELYDIRGQKTNLWIKNRLEDTPQICYSKMGSLRNSLYSEEYIEELIQEYIDNLNILYVALTRCREAISIIGDLPKAKNKGINIESINNVSKFLYSALLSKNMFSEDNEGKNREDEEELFYQYPRFSDYIAREKPRKEEAYNKIPIPSSLHKARVKYSQTKIAEDYISAMLDDKTDSLTPRQRGIILHNLLSDILLIDDKEKALASAIHCGKISFSEKKFFEKLLDNMLFSQPQTKDWFSGRYRVLNEIDIIFSNNGEISSKRPDRLMIDSDNNVIIIDYKFASSRHNLEEYRSQLRGYRSLLLAMGFVKISSYLWFVSLNDNDFSSEIIAVE